jgi:hypothetical protein
MERERETPSRFLQVKLKSRASEFFSILFYFIFLFSSSKSQRREEGGGVGGGRNIPI